MSLVAGVVAGADSIDDMAVLLTAAWAGSSTGRTRRRSPSRSPAASSCAVPPT